MKDTYPVAIRNRAAILALLPATAREVYRMTDLAEATIRKHLRAMEREGGVTVAERTRRHNGRAGKLSMVYAATGKDPQTRHEIAKVEAAQRLASYFSVTIPTFLGDVNQLEAESQV